MRQLILAALLLVLSAGLTVGVFPVHLGDTFQISSRDAALFLLLFSSLALCESVWAMVVMKRANARLADLRKVTAASEEAAQEIAATREALDSVRARCARLEEQNSQLDRRLAAAAEATSQELEDLRAALLSAETTARETSARKVPSGHEVMHFISRLQEKGRFLDFVMEDVTGLTDQQIGAASRFVHDGCRAVVREYLELSPVQDGEEGKPVTITAGRNPAEVRFVGRSASTFPVTGRLVHRGWRVTRSPFPELSPTVERAAVLAPAEVEIN